MNFIESWKDKISNYVDVRLGLLKLSLIERTSTLLATVVMSFIFLMVGLAVMTFVGWGLMEWFMVLLDSRIWGAFLTAGLFVVLAIILYALRRLLIASFAGIFIHILTRDIDHDDEKENDTAK